MKISAFKKERNIVIKIHDNAKGIIISPIEKIFEPYISSKHVNMGTGIGLYMSKVIIEKNFKGSLSVSNENNGAKFSIYLVNF